MRHQCILDTVDRFDLSRYRIHPVDGLSFSHVFKRGLMFSTEQGTQINMPIAFVLFPPIEVNVKRSINSRFDEAKTFCCHHHDHSTSFKRKCKSPTCVNWGWLASRAKSGAGGTRRTIFTAEYSSCAWTCPCGVSLDISRIISATSLSKGRFRSCSQSWSTASKEGMANAIRSLNSAEMDCFNIANTIPPSAPMITVRTQSLVRYAFVSI